MAEAVDAAGAAALAALSGYETGSAYLNFVERPADAAAFYAAEDLRAPARAARRRRPARRDGRQPPDAGGGT
jgi:hypothetical protein